MKKLLLPALLITLFHASLIAQNKYTFTQRANLRVGALYSFQNGANFDSIMKTSKASIHGTAFLGYRFDPKNTGANYFGVFAALGSVSQRSILEIKSTNALPIPVTYTSGSASLKELEVGFIFADWFRLSAGPGFLSLPITGGKQSYNYYSSTAGLIIKAGPLNFNSTTGIQFGGDLLKPLFRVGIGASLSFTFINSRKKY
jgi:hypothetical protein